MAQEFGVNYLPEWLLNLDRALFLKINGDWSNAFFDRVMPVATDFVRYAPWWWYALMLGLNLFWLYHYRWRVLRAMMMLVLAVGLADNGSYRLFKPLFARSRPAQSGLAVKLRVQAHSGLSFPSNHAANSFAAAAVITSIYAPAGWLVFPLAFVVAYSRVYVGVHFPLDVTAGALWGLFCAGLIIFVERILARLWVHRQNVQQKKQLREYMRGETP